MLSMRYFPALLFLISFFLLSASATTAQAQTSTKLQWLKLSKTDQRNVFRYVKPNHKVRLEMRTQGSDDDYFSARKSHDKVIKGHVDHFSPGKIHLRDGTVVNIEDIESMSNLSSGNTEKASAAVALAGSLLVIGYGVAVGQTEPEPRLVSFTIIVLGIATLVVAPFAYLMGMLSASKEYDLTGNWKAEVVERH